MCAPFSELPSSINNMHQLFFREIKSEMRYFYAAHSPLCLYVGLYEFSSFFLFTNREIPFSIKDKVSVFELYLVQFSIYILERKNTGIKSQVILTQASLNYSWCCKAPYRAKMYFGGRGCKRIKTSSSFCTC